MSQAFFLYQGDNLQVTIDGDTFTVNRNTNSNFDEIVDALARADWDLVRDLANPGRALAAFYSNSGDTELEVFGNKVTVNGERLALALEDRLVSMYEARLPLTPLVNFLERVRKNPSYTARQELYLFLEGNNLPLTPDGCFMAYKSVMRWDENNGPEFDDMGRAFAPGDFQSIGTNRENGLPTRYRVGDVVEMERGSVDDNRERTCSAGLHFASLNYASTWSSWDALLLLKLDPADVVSIPNDYGNQKGRAWRFTVHSVYKENEVRDRGTDVPEAFTSPVYDMSDPNGRWEVRRQSDDSLVNRFASREDARWTKWDSSEALYIWDRDNGIRVS